MNLFYQVLLLLTVAAASAAARRSQRSKRGILELAAAVGCSTGRSALVYIGYGCYCGLGGHGWPIDQTDWCCHKHDCCYGYAEEKGCHTKTARYEWTCKDKVFECEDLEDKCEKMLCKCDKDISKCLRKAPFNRRFALMLNLFCDNTEP
ncbi:phospholipase A2-like, partial [Brachionichthys hirsutus]|uniref:phospholipase A2-like n=1 Tax=Brachionichthys hirsutus TaxID=412623 RepID=UPI0036050A5E